MTATRPARRDASLAAQVVASEALRYAEGEDAALDRPAHVRAGSSLAWVPGGIALVQDDANFVAVVEPESARTRAITLPAGEAGLRRFDDGRGNKRYKLDLEACVAVREGADTVLIALGSGSTERRERVVMVRGWEARRPEVSVVHAGALYAALRRERAFAGSEMNVEGAVQLGALVRLFARGNGAPREGVRPANASCDLDWPALRDYLRQPERAAPPTPTNVTPYELGALEGIPLGFTDATPWGELLLYSAAAEDSPDAVRDGRVAGSAIGVIDREGSARWTALTDADGAPFVGKVEGLVADPGRRERLFVVVDADDPDAPSMLCTVELRGPWGG